MKYACKQRYFDNGETSASVFRVPDDTEKYSDSQENWDEYLDVFDTKAEAEQCKKNTLNA